MLDGASPSHRATPSSPRAPAALGDGRGALSASGKPDPEGPVWRGNAFHTNAWERVADDQPLPDAPVIVSKTRWLAERDRLAGRNAPLGLQVEPAEALDDIAADLGRFALIALSFPKFADGRAFSTAALLREKHGFAGELRAVGAVLSDQIPYMRRMGFDTFEVAHVPTRRALAEGRILEVTLHYQPAIAHEAPAGTRPWLRRSGD
jgi:phosphoadenosine phosphosulfate reductase